jgi:hypothetical protein
LIRKLEGKRFSGLRVIAIVRLQQQFGCIFTLITLLELIFGINLRYHKVLLTTMKSRCSQNLRQIAAAVREIWLIVDLMVVVGVVMVVLVVLLLGSRGAGSMVFLCGIFARKASISCGIISN